MNLKLPNVYINDSLYLRQIIIEDYYDYYLIGSNKLNTKYLTWDAFNSPFKALEALKDMIYYRPLNNLPIGYSIIYNNKMVGIIDYHTYYEDLNAAEIGYILNYDYHNLGIMSKCLKEVIKVGFNYLQYDCLFIGTVKENIASLKVILKNKFKYYYKKDIFLKTEIYKAYYFKRCKNDL